MEPQDQVSASDKSLSEKEGIELQVRNSSNTLSSERDDPGSITQHLQEIKSSTEEVACEPDKVKDISSIESSNVIVDSKVEISHDESTNVSVEKGGSLGLLTESSNMSVKKENFDTTPIEVVDISQEEDISQTSNEENVMECTKESSQICSTDTSGEVLGVESLQSLCVKQEVTESGNLQADSNFMNKKEACEYAVFKNLADVVTTASENNSTADSAENASEENVLDKQSRIPAETVYKENICYKSSGATTKNASEENSANEHSADTPELVKENVIKQDSNIATKTEILDQKKEENVPNEQLPTAKISIGENVSNETADMGASETEPREPSVSSQPEKTEDDSERRAFFYISSSSVPGMGKEWEWPSVSNSYEYQRPPRRMERRRNISGSRNCLGTQRCHYIILAVGVLGAILGCLTYHLQDYGIGPKVLRPIGASAAFLSFVVCAFSSVYLTYLSYYTQPRSSHNDQPLDMPDPVATMLIDTMPQCYNSDPRFYFTSSAAATAQQVYRETRSVNDMDKRGFSWQPSELKWTYNEPGPSGYYPDSKRIKMDPTVGEGEVYEMKSMGRIGENDHCKERNPSQTSDSSHYTLADQVLHPSSSSRESEYNEKTPLLPKK